jgi:hypothetical protein
LYSLGPSEQIEIRELAQVVINSKALPNAQKIFVYKNFNGNKVLENTAGANRSYTLKEGEYIFYTDHNKTEFAYFTAGTEVVLTGSARIPECDIIDLAVIFDSGIQEIPWKSLDLSHNNSITFVEYQYVTLGNGDTVNQLTFEGKNGQLDNDWQECYGISYTPAGAEKASTLPKISVSNFGWKASSVLELNTSQSNTQTIRKTDKIETSITLHKASSVGQDQANEDDVIIAAKDNDHAISFRANLACQSSNSKLGISDVFFNPDSIKSFELKVFAEETPALLKTVKGSLVPYRDPAITDVIDITKWPVSTRVSIEEFGDIWKPVSISTYFASAKDEDYDNALRLSATVLPNTYGIFSIYIDYRSTLADDAKTWIELLPGASNENITLFNVNADEIVWEDDNTKLMLKPGINCIRINKTDNIFIKTKATDGVLYFDNIRLVDCQQLEYENAAGDTIKQTTQGLNLDQIGYLDASAESGAVDTRILKKLKDEYTTEAVNALNKLDSDETAKYNLYKEDLIADKDKLQSLLTFIDNAKTEVNTLSNTANIDTLFTNYKNIVTDLKQEKELQKKLADAQDIDEVEQQLVSLLEKFTNTGVSKQEFISELDTLRQAVLAKLDGNIESLSDGDIITDFEVAADNTYEHLVNDLKIASIKEINAVYSTQLETISTAVKEITDSTTRETLLSILDEANTSKQAELAAQIQALVTTYGQQTINDLLNNALVIAAGQENPEAAAGSTREVDYATLLAILLTIKQQLGNYDFVDLIAQIEQVLAGSMSNSDKYAKLRELVAVIKPEDAKTSTTTGDTATGDIITVKSLLDSLTGTNGILPAVETKLSTNDKGYSQELYSKLDNFLADFSKLYNGKLDTILGDIQDILKDLDSSYTAAITALATAEQSAVGKILSLLSEYTNARQTSTSKVDALVSSTFKYEDLPYWRAAVKAVWPVYIKQSVIADVDKLYTDIRSAITSGTFTTAPSISSSREIIKDFTNFNTFLDVFNRAKASDAEFDQNGARKTLIESIWSASPFASELKNIAALNATRNITLNTLIADIKASTSVTKKQQLIKELKNELDTIIKVDTQLEEISAKLLCPHILFAESKLPAIKTDKFYDRLAKFIFVDTVINGEVEIESEKTKLLTLASGFGTALSAIATKLGNASDVITELKTAIDSNTIDELSTGWWNAIEEEENSETLLTKEYLAVLVGIKNTFDTKAKIAAAKDSKLITDLKANNTVTEDSTKREGEWLSSEGSVIETNVTIDAILTKLLQAVIDLGDTTSMSESLKEVYNVIKLEEMLLDELRALDKNREFYYSVPVDSNIAIDFNDGDIELNTLMNPAVNYDINNVNNTAVISKLDINYLDSGLQIARSSRLN